MFSTSRRPRRTGTARVVRAVLGMMLAAIGLPLTLLVGAQPAAAVGLPPKTVTVVLQPSTITADGSSLGKIIATVKDTADQTFTDPEGEVKPTRSGDVFVPSRLSQRSDGTWVGTYRASKTADVETITVTAQNAATVGTPPSGTAQLTETAGPPSTLAIKLAPPNVKADGIAKTTATVTVKDVNGNGVPGQTIVVGVGTGGDSQPGPVTDHNDGTYTSEITSSTTPGPETITATGAGKTASTTLTEYGTASTVVLTLAPSTVVADGAQTSVATATVKDVGGNGVADEVVTILPTSGGADSTVTPVVNNNDGTYTATITSSKTADTETYTANATHANKVGTANLIETAGPLTSFTLSLTPSTITADGADTSVATATAKDANDNPVKNEAVTMVTNGDSAVSSVTNHNDGTYTATITSSKTADAETITATAANAGKTATSVLTEQPGAATKVGLVLAPSTVTADGQSTSLATATVKDANNNPVKDETVVFSTGPKGDVTIGNTTNNGDGTYKATIISSTTADIETIKATATKSSAFGTAPLTEVPGPAANVDLVLAPTTVIANGTSTSKATATVTDVNDNPVTDEVVTIVTGGDATVGTVTNKGDGTYTATITSSTTADTETITATATKSNKTATAPLVETPGPAATVDLVLNPSSIPANGSSTSTATATVTDAHGNAVKNETVTMASNGNAGVGGVVNHNDGTYTATITASNTPSTQTITALATNANKSDTATLGLFGPTQTVSVAAAPASIPADGTSKGTVTATLKDAGNNPVTNATVAFGTETGGDISFGAVTNHGDGTYTSQYTASNTPGVETITATGGGKSGTTDITEFGPATSITMALQPATVVANGTSTSTATATVKDAGGNLVTNETVTFSTDGDASPAATVNHADGTYSSLIKSSKTADTETITATATKANKVITATLTETPGPATSVVLVLTPSTLTANGTSTSSATATVTDVNGNAVKTETVKLATSGDATPVSSGVTTNNSNGTYTGTIKASTTADSETITATALGTGAFGTATLTETPGAATAVAFALSPSTIVADGASTSTATATVTDANGNKVKTSTVTIATNGDSSPSAVTNNGDGTYKSTITSSKTSGLETITAAVSGTSLSKTATLTEKAGPATKVVVALSPASVPADGKSTSTAIATVTDANANKVLDETVTMSTSGDVTLGSVTNNGDGTYKSTITASKTAGAENITAKAVNAAKTGSAQLIETLTSGYWLTGADAGVFNYGAAGLFGSQGGKPLNKPVVGMAFNPADRAGYWQVASDGGIFNWGSAGFFGAMGDKRLNSPVVGIAPAPDGKGYWMVASDGGVFNFGSAGYFGSMGGQPLNKPVVGILATPSGKGYWLVASDGGIFAFGDAVNRFFGSTGGMALNSPIVGMASTPNGDGYWLVARDGGIFAYGTATNAFFGSLGGKGINDIVGMQVTTSGRGYRMAGGDGSVYVFGDAPQSGSPKASGLKLVRPISGIAGF
jgi:adhesin/invasin